MSVKTGQVWRAKAWPNRCIVIVKVEANTAYTSTYNTWAVAEVESQFNYVDELYDMALLGERSEALKAKLDRLLNVTRNVVDELEGS